MEAMRTTYAKKTGFGLNTWRKRSRNIREYLKGKRVSFAKNILFRWIWKVLLKWGIRHVSLFLFVTTHFWIFVRKFLVHLRTMYATPQKLARPLFRVLRPTINVIVSIQSNAADEHDWQTSYIRGVSNEMYTEFLSKAFKGMNFQQASEWVPFVVTGREVGDSGQALHCRIM